MRRRTLGADGPTLSQIAYGTMRMRPEVDGRSPVDVLCELHDLGVDTHHSSHEYDSHPLYLDALAEARRGGRRFEHDVKLSSPSFDADPIEVVEIERLVDRELETLGCDRLVSVQWLLRTPDPTDDAARIALLHEQLDEITGLFDYLAAAGKVANVSVFPYSVEFARVALAALGDATLTTYLSAFELDYAPLLEVADSFLAIRPFAGAPAGVDSAPELDGLGDPDVSPWLRALEFPLLHPNVTTVIVSANRTAHLSFVEAASDVAPDQERFDSMLSTLRGVAA